MIVETHLFKEEFVKGDAAGFVVCADLPPAAGRAAKRIFAEIYGRVGCYHIFEDRAEAERHLALAAAGSPPRESLSVHEVRVENIRDYQILAGFKVVVLVNREGQATWSLRVGDMPLAARTNTPFPGPLPAGVRVIDSKPRPQPPASPPAGDFTEAITASDPGPRVRRPMRLVIDPPESEAHDVGDDSASSSRESGFFSRLFSRFFGWF